MHICCEKKRFCLVVLEPHGKKWDVILEIHPHIRNPVFPGLAATDSSEIEARRGDTI
jgi:hypothetical protein